MSCTKMANYHCPRTSDVVAAAVVSLAFSSHFQLTTYIILPSSIYLSISLNYITRPMEMLINSNWTRLWGRMDDNFKLTRLRTVTQLVTVSSSHLINCTTLLFQLADSV